LFTVPERWKFFKKQPLQSLEVHPTTAWRRLKTLLCTLPNEMDRTPLSTLGTPQWFFEMWELFLPHSAYRQFYFLSEFGPWGLNSDDFITFFSYHFTKLIPKILKTPVPQWTVSYIQFCLDLQLSAVTNNNLNLGVSEYGSFTLVTKAAI
jgi:hypothetical protein